jgi:hypothetical protein
VTPSLSADYFAHLYADSDDPWRISTGWYEQRKRALLMASLPRERFAVGFEPGCSNGELTVLLASRCQSRFGLSRPARDSLNHGCSSEV